MYSRSSVDVLLAFTALTAASLYSAYAGGSALPLVPLTALAFAASGNARSVYVALYFSSLSLQLLSQSPAVYVLSSLVAVLAVVHLYRSESRGILKSALVPTVVASPIYVATPRTALVASASLLALLAILAREYLRVSKSRVEFGRVSASTYLGSTVDVPIKISCPGLFKYRVEVGGGKVSEGVGSGEVLVSVPIAATTLGLSRRTVRVRVSDIKDIASVDHKPVVVELRTQMRVSEAVRRAEAVLKKFAAYISVPVVLVAELRGVGPGSGSGTGAGRVFGGAGGEGAGQLAPSSDDRREFRVELRWRTPAKLLEKLSGALKSLIGEYLGVREYQPGDSPRSIHWKKSLRTESVENIVVKVFGSEEIEKVSGGGEVAILADLAAPNPVELDALLQAVYSTVLAAVGRGGDAFSQVYLYIELPNDKLYFIAGKAIDVLHGLNTILLSEKVETYHNYESWNRVEAPIVGEPRGILKDLANYYAALGNQLARDLEERGIKKGTVVQLLFSKTSVFKFYYVSTSLRRAGYVVTIPR
ncbi:MAG: DUF58 domain-containing protein [Sulfolobales archaeon]|nr:DUF58 domain-containing protein [Sulfolobales archaeon]